MAEAVRYWTRGRALLLGPLLVGVVVTARLALAKSDLLAAMGFIPFFVTFMVYSRLAELEVGFCPKV